MTTDVPSPLTPSPPAPAETQPIASTAAPPAPPVQRRRVGVGLTTGCITGTVGGAFSGAATLTALMLADLPDAEPGEIAAGALFTVFLWIFAAPIGAAVGLVAGGVLGTALSAARVEHLAPPVAVLAANGPLLAFFVVALVSGDLHANVFEGASAGEVFGVISSMMMQTAIGIVVGDQFAKRTLARRRP